MLHAIAYCLKYHICESLFSYFPKNFYIHWNKTWSILWGKKKKKLYKWLQNLSVYLVFICTYISISEKTNAWKDDFLFELDISDINKYAFFKICTQCLFILFHRNADIEMAFSDCKECLVENINVTLCWVYFIK